MRNRKRHRALFAKSKNRFSRKDSDADLAESVGDAAHELAEVRMGRLEVDDRILQPIAKRFVLLVHTRLRIFRSLGQDALNVGEQLRQPLAGLHIEFRTRGEFLMQPRKRVVMAGVFASHMPVSQMNTTSALSLSRFIAT